MYLKNTWYMAAWSTDIEPGKLFHRQLLDRPIVFFRTAQGAVVALEDRCPHRFAPLHLGKLVGDQLQCPYHGLQFDATGRCVFNPQGPAPAAAKVQSFPVIERMSGVWIWMGDAAKANPDLLPRFDVLDEHDWHVGTGYLHIQAHYELETDNILDLSHIEFLHPLFASDAVRAAKVQWAQEGETVWSKRFISQDRPPDFIYDGFGIPHGERMDRWLDVRWNAPASMLLLIGGVASGQPRESGRELQQAHIFTPESATSTHYFFSASIARAAGPDGAQFARQSVEILRGPFENEDKPIVEAIARNMGDRSFWDMKPVLLPSDAASVLARRLLAQKIAAEQSV